jgi:hypothetical protein
MLPVCGKMKTEIPVEIGGPSAPGAERSSALGEEKNALGRRSTGDKQAYTLRCRKPKRTFGGKTFSSRTQMTGKGNVIALLSEDVHEGIVIEY